MACYNELHKEALTVLTELFGGGAKGASMASTVLGARESQFFTGVFYPGVVEGKVDAVVAARVTDLVKMGYGEFAPFQGDVFVQQPVSNVLLGLGAVLVSCNKAAGSVGFGLGFIAVAALGLWWLFKKR